MKNPGSMASTSNPLAEQIAGVMARVKARSDGDGGAVSAGRTLGADLARQRIKNVPALFHDNDPGRFPPIWSTVLGWDPASGRGLGLIGPSGVCKTRMIYERLMTLQGQGGFFFGLSSFALQEAIQMKWKDDASKALVKRARKTKLLFLDDLGKQKFTDSAANELFDIINERFENKRALVFTSNRSGRDLEAALGENVGKPLLRRLGEFCDVHTVKEGA